MAGDTDTDGNREGDPDTPANQDPGHKPGDRPLPPGVTPNPDGSLPDLDKQAPGMGSLYPNEDPPRDEG